MKLKRYNKASLQSRIAPTIPNLRINSTGTITLNKPLADLLKLKDDSKVELIQDEEKPKEWYIVVNDEEVALPVRPNKSQAGYLIQNATLAKTFCQSVDPEQKILCMNVAATPTEHEGELLWAVITSSYKQYIKSK